MPRPPTVWSTPPSLSWLLAPSSINSLPSKHHCHESIRDSTRAQQSLGYFPAPFQGSRQRDFVGVFEVAPDRKSPRDLRDPNAQRTQQSGEVDGGRLTFDVRVGGQDHLCRLLALQASEQFADLQIVRTDAFNRRERAVQDVVEALVAASALEGQDIERLLD